MWGTGQDRRISWARILRECPAWWLSLRPPTTDERRMGDSRGALTIHHESRHHLCLTSVMWIVPAMVLPYSPRKRHQHTFQQCHHQLHRAGV